MFSNGNHQNLVHLQRTPPSPPDQLPRGECRFILPRGEAESAQQRCSCVSFTLNKTIPGSQCGCGHQAWHHLPESSERSVSQQEHTALLDRLKRSDDVIQRLQDELMRERKAREESSQKLIEMVKGNYQNMAVLKYMFEEKLEVQRIHCEDKTEGVLDKAHGAIEEIEKLKLRFSEMDESIMRVEERLDTGRWESRATTPFPETTFTPPPVPALPAVTKALTLPVPTASTPSIPLAIRTEDKHPEAWDVRVILVPDKKQHFAYPLESTAYRRCLSRGMTQDLHIQDKSARSFVQCVDAGFASILRGRSWLPLRCLRSETMALAPLPVSQIMYLMWDWGFVEEHCLAHDKMQGDIVYIALQDEVLSWETIRKLPKVFGSDESCWHEDAELDNTGASAKEKDPDTNRMDVQIHPARRMDSAYENSPPPYTQRYLEATRAPSALGVLAAAATYSSASLPSSLHSTGSTSNINSLLNPDNYDEHRTKRTKHQPLRPEHYQTDMQIERITTSSSAERPVTAGSSYSSSSLTATSPPQQMYLSGRSRRKINTTKQREPMDWRPSEMKFGNSMRGLMHRQPKTSAPEEPSSHTQMMDIH